MIDVIPSLAPQQGIVETAGDTSSNSGCSTKQNASSDFSFADALSAVVSGEQVVGGCHSDSGLAPGEVESAEPTPDTDNSEASTINGAIQMVMAVPVRPDATALVGDVPEVVVADEITSVSSDAVPRRIASGEAGQDLTLVSGAMPQAGGRVPEAVPGQAVEPTSDLPAANAEQTTPIIGTATQGVSDPDSQPVVGSVPLQGTGPSVVSDNEETTQHARQHSATITSSTMADSVDANPRTGFPVGTMEPVTVPVTVAEAGTQASAAANVQAQDQPIIKGEQARTSDRRLEEPNARLEVGGPDKPRTAAQQRVPVENVPVQWRFEGQPQVTNSATGAEALAYLSPELEGVNSTPETGVGEAFDFRLASARLGTVESGGTGVQFSAQLSEAAQRTVSQASESDLHTRVIDQVVRQVNLSRIDGRDNLVVRLNPPELGSLRLQIVQDAAGMSTHIQASSSQARGLLEAHMPVLMDSLAKAGLRMDSVSVSVDTSTANAFAGGAHQGDAHPNSNHARQQYTTSRDMGQLAAMAEASFPTRGRSAQMGYSWLA